MSGDSFAKTICSICYEDLKPIVEDLQAISICGHVFHELCLQQWFEYSSSAKKCSCPVCKQNCTPRSASRLYFQSLGDPNEAVLSQKEAGCTEDPELLRGEVRRLEGKVLGLTSVRDCQEKEIKQLNEELCVTKEQLNKEVTSRNDAVRQKTTIQQLLLKKSEEFDRVKLDCLRLEDRNLALAKELAALKLVSDLNLDEDEILKLASFGNNGNNKDTIEILRKSLVIRNKSYTELMAKCNQLGRGEARSSQKLEKAKEKIDKLKTRVQELEMVVEVKDNEALRALKTSKKTNAKVLSAKDISNCQSGHNVLSIDQREQNSVSVDHFDHIGSLTSDQEKFKFTDVTLANSIKECNSNKQNKVDLPRDRSTSELPSVVHVLSDSEFTHPTTEVLKDTNQANSEAFSYTIGETKVHGVASPDGPFGIATCIHRDEDSIIDAFEEADLSVHGTRQVQSTINIRKESPLPVPSSRPGDICFSGGLMGPDGANRYLGKWCKRGQSKGTMTTQGARASSGDLIAVGSDGRGGTVKVLRSLNQSLLDDKEKTAPTKRYKYGAKPSNLQSQGCLQIEHFFGRANH